MKTARRVLAAVALAAGSMAASADPVTYQYTGPPLTYVDTGVPGVTQLSATFTVDLGANFFGSAPISDWIFTDGVTTIASTNTDYAVADSLFQTDALGGIVGVDIQVLWSPNNTIGHPLPVGANGIQWFVFVGDPLLWQGTVSAHFSYTGYCTSSLPSGQCDGTAAAYDWSGGTLSVVPEPGVLALLAIGLAGLGLTRRKAV